LNVDALFASCDIAIMSAAVADYTPIQVASQKIKKQNDAGLTIELQKTKDILKHIGNKKSDHQIVVGFALETENEELNAQKKLKEKNADFIVLNSMNNKGAGFKHNTNQVTILKNNGEKLHYNLKSKYDVAIDIVNEVVKTIENKHA
jgi:phosphopantothenoylcysteine decarboxylase/phosphopantothenate--cysteine ligase